jgi:3'-5' exoribonuclease 1
MDREQEIIEIGAYRVNGYGEWMDHFQAFIKPVMNPRLSTYCMDLTGITQDQVGKAKTFGQVFPIFEDWFYREDGLIFYAPGEEKIWI